MREMYEFRVLEEFSSLLFGKNEGKRLGETVRKIEIQSEDPRFCKIGQLQREIQTKTGRSFFYGWILRRKYTKAELSAAVCFRWNVTTAFEPAGEERGTIYDESNACSRCGAGARQASDLYLDWKSIPKNKDFARTISGELIASKRVVNLFLKNNVAGVQFRPIRHNRASSAQNAEWFQVIIISHSAEITSPTRTGIDPFDEDVRGEARCPKGDLLGLNLLSEVYIKKSTRGDADILATRQFIGVRRGLLRPQRILLLSPKVRELIEQENLKGLEVEVAHLAH